ncbi:hypothetical protein FGSG_10502 [Fusarium graminearum PH-1]|uniref:hypothetical protein n=1 Tax=Gibberella zeae (strain ATCC MYA-4620 / CBS 123657 / FGSC 9075 / NRRL 31084 / PH-1) TaxID=229533 RepID=UPI00021F24B7|nr:hypothetical protein FGSG_10502 [Fusarium graminearum PH-1]ESU17230.1 hypothetical protein FGSG_10502 [Fusarium graminearum PH-1]|eukprot:XP_011319492.1 hypothetical protein FGSG_10502 [Fusarium graminearum PH-1]
MEPDDIPKWDFGQLPKGINPVSNDFIPFFATTDGTRVDADKISLSFDLAAPTSRTHAFAWDRVPALSSNAKGKSRQIMKRVAVCTKRKQSQPFVLLPQVNFVIPNTRESIAFDESLPRKVRRGTKFEPISREAAYSGKAMTHAFMLSELMMATINVANNFMYTSSCTSYEDRRAARNGICQITPLKRRADVLNNEPDVPVMLAPTGGNKLGFYYKVLPMIKRAYSRGMTEVDLTTGSMVKLSTSFLRRRRNPREHVAAFGVPDLSDIADESEPESPTVVREPVLKFESRSPAKRLARLANPFSKSTSRGNRLAQGFVKLVPGLARGGFSTPVKSRSSPVPQTASPVYDYAVASLQYSPSASDDEADDDASSSKEGSPEPAEDLPSSPVHSPGRTFRVPSEFDSSSIAGDESIQGPPSTPNQSSPVNFSRPVGPTPSRWNRPEPTTPFTPIPQTATAATPAETDSPIGLYALLAPDTPKAPTCTYETLSGTDPIDFGAPSAFESSLSWMNTSATASEQARSQKRHHARRRRSEPLLLKSVLTQARRRSASPQKLRFKADDTFHDVISIASLFDLPTSDDSTVAEPTTAEPILAEHTAEPILTEPTAEPILTEPTAEPILAEPTAEPILAEPAAKPILAEPTAEPIIAEDTEMSDTNVAVTRDVAMDDPVPIATTDDNVAETIDHPVVHDQPAPTEQSIVEIDMRENPDIFGAHPSSPPAPIQNLSRMADDACSGLAKVVVTEENGRLFVRFKLSAEYAHMFPASQGFEDNDLTLSPSAASSTPKAKSSHQLAITATPQPMSAKRVTRRQSAMTPLKRATMNATEAAQLRTPAPVTNPNHATPKFATPATGNADQTLAVSWSDVDDTPTQLNIRSQPTEPSPATPRFATPATGSADQTLAVSWSDVEDTPTELDFHSQHTEPSPATPRFASPAVTNDDTTIIFPWSDVEDSPARFRTRPQPAPSHATPKFATPAAGNDTTLAVPWPDVATPAPAQSSASTEVVPAEDEHQSVAAVDNDSPNREFMRSFIARTRQHTATESGSPTPLAATRKPLGALSPNRGTPMMAKRKHEGEDEDGEEKPSPKKAKLETRGKVARMKSNLDIDMVDFPATQVTESSVPTPTDAANEEAASPPTTRRSSRLRGQGAGGPKSSLPTPIKLSRAGAGRGSLARKPRSEEQELDRKTRSNTKKNMGDAESPAEVLTRIKDQAEEDSDVGEGSAGGRRVGWKDPLEKVQGSSPKKRAEPKGKATQGKTGLAKPKATRAAKVAEGPKSQRVTRSRARGGA